MCTEFKEVGFYQVREVSVISKPAEGESQPGLRESSPGSPQPFLEAGGLQAPPGGWHPVGVSGCVVLRDFQAPPSGWNLVGVPE